MFHFFLVLVAAQAMLGGGGGQSGGNPLAMLGRGGGQMGGNPLAMLGRGGSQMGGNPLAMLGGGGGQMGGNPLMAMRGRGRGMDLASLGRGDGGAGLANLASSLGGLEAGRGSDIASRLNFAGDGGDQGGDQGGGKGGFPDLAALLNGRGMGGQPPNMNQQDEDRPGANPHRNLAQLLQGGGGGGNQAQELFRPRERLDNASYRRAGEDGLRGREGMLHMLGEQGFFPGQHAAPEQGQPPARGGDPREYTLDRLPDNVSRTRPQPHQLKPSKPRKVSPSRDPKGPPPGMFPEYERGGKYYYWTDQYKEDVRQGLIEAIPQEEIDRLEAEAAEEIKRENSMFRRTAVF